MHDILHCLEQNAHLQQQLQNVLFANMKELAKSARRPVGIPAQLAGGAKPTVTQLRDFVEGASNKFSTQQCQTPMCLLDLWLKDVQMPVHQLESPLGSDEKLRLWEITHACIDCQGSHRVPLC